MTINQSNVIKFISAMLIVSACGHDNGIGSLVDASMKEAGDNALQLQTVLDSHDGELKGVAEYTVASVWGQCSRKGPGMDSIEALYAELHEEGITEFDSIRLKAGKRFAEMPLHSTKDATSITADYLNDNIKEAVKSWKTRSWNNNLPEEIFCETLLPYRIGDEPFTSWRGPYREWLADIEDSLSSCTGTVEAAKMIVERIGQCPYNDQLSTPHRTALDLLNTPIGYCREDCDRNLYAIRALGVPVAIDKMLVSPENGSAHMWTVVWDNIDGKMRMFDNYRYRPTRDSIHYDKRRKGKIYRMTFLPDLQRLERYQNIDNAPTVLLNPRLKDVTAEYFGHNKAEVKIWREVLKSEKDGVYLGVFANQRFQPADIGERDGGKAIFHDIEPSLIYAPITSRGTVCGMPFLLDDQGKVLQIVPNEDDVEHITLTRKFPMRFHQVNRLNSMVGMHVQSSHKADGPWRDLEVIETAPTNNYRRIRMDDYAGGRYFRLLNAGEGDALLSALLVCRDTLGLDPMPLTLVGNDEAKGKYWRLLNGEYNLELEPGAEDCILHLESQDEIKSIYLQPWNDDNFVVPAQEYELLYFAGKEGWRSVGKKMSEGFSIEFAAPKGAILWLRNLTKGREEQIFIWRDGRQLFNLDLYEYTHESIN